MLDSAIERSAAAILATGRRPRIAVLLGSGWSPLAERVAQPLVLPYDTLPAFPAPGVEGHAARLVLGRIGAHEVACWPGAAMPMKAATPQR